MIVSCHTIRKSLLSVTPFCTLHAVTRNLAVFVLQTDHVPFIMTPLDCSSVAHVGLSNSELHIPSAVSPFNMRLVWSLRPCDIAVGAASFIAPPSVIALNTTVNLHEQMRSLSNTSLMTSEPTTSVKKISTLLPCFHRTASVN